MRSRRCLHPTANLWSTTFVQSTKRSCSTTPPKGAVTGSSNGRCHAGMLPDADVAERSDTCSVVERWKLFEKAFLYVDRWRRASNTYSNTHLITPNQLTFSEWLMKKRKNPIDTSLYPLNTQKLLGKVINVQQASPTKFTFHITAFAFKQCSAPEKEYRRDAHPKRMVVHQALDALVPTSSIVMFTEIDKGPLRDMQEKLRLQYGFDHHAVEMRLTETSVRPNKRTEARTHSSRGHNLVAWDKSVFQLISVNDLTLKRWTFPGVVLQHRETGERFWVVGVHLTPRREHRPLLEQLEIVGKHCLPDNVRNCVAKFIVLGDLNVQYSSFGKARMEDKRYMWSIENRHTEPKNRRTKLTNRRIKQKRQTQRQTKRRTKQKHRADKRYNRSLENRRTEPKSSSEPKESLNALGALVGSSDGTAQSESDMVHVNSCKSVELPKEYRALTDSTDHPHPLLVTVTASLFRSNVS